MLFLNCIRLDWSSVWILHMSLASDSFLKGCSLSQSRTYGNEHFRSAGPEPVFVSCGISPSPSFSLRRICLILSVVTSWFLASRSQNKVNAALFRLYGSYLIIERISSCSHNSASKYGLRRLVFFSLILAKWGVIHSDWYTNASFSLLLWNHLKKYLIRPR